MSDAGHRRRPSSDRRHRRQRGERAHRVHRARRLARHRRVDRRQRVPGRPGSRRARRRRVRLVHLVTRARHVGVGGATRGRGAAASSSERHDDGTTIGRVDDVCRRALGLPTAPAGSTLEFWALLWLERRRFGHDAVPTTWEPWPRCTPAVAVFAEDATRISSAEASASLVQPRRAPVEACIDWSELRAECGAGRWPRRRRAADRGSVARRRRVQPLGDGQLPAPRPADSPPRANCSLPRSAGDVPRRVSDEWGLDPPR